MLLAVASDGEVSDKAVRLATKHRDESGIVFDVRWPVSYRYFPATTESVMCVGVERGFLGRRVRFQRHRLQRRKPVFLSVRPGTYVFALTSMGHRHEDEMTLVVQVERSHPQAITCWPAKRRLLSPERRQTRWVVTSLPQA